MIERIHLTILREIDRQGSLTAAAVALHLSQSALSHAIKKLERQLGTNLWNKKGRGLRLTQTGSYLLAAGNRLLPQLERIDAVVSQYASGEKGALHIGMECHPCYRWLLKIVEPYLQQWPNIDIDVKQKFQFGGMAALFSHEIDILVTPDPIDKPGVQFMPVFDYEQVLVTATGHHLSAKPYITPKDLMNETLFSYPVESSRLDIYSRFLLPAGCLPQKCKTVEATDIMLQMVATGRGVAALPGWLVDEYSKQLTITAVRLGEKGIAKTIYLGVREGDQLEPRIAGFLSLSRSLPE